jgi:cystathionine gamma-synthase
MDITTKLAHAGHAADEAYNSVTSPIYQTSSFRFESVGKTTGYEYSRLGNPTRGALEDILTELEGGMGAVATCSGMAAISTALSIFDHGMHVICTHDGYGGTTRLLNWLCEQGKIEVSFVNLREPQAVANAVKKNTHVVWIETPSNPLLRVIDLESVIADAHSANLTAIVDNTFLSPLFQRPIALGADIVVHSTTKYLNGHADVVGGAIISRTREFDKQIQDAAMILGTIAPPFDAWLVMRGLKTLSLRMKQHEHNAFAVANFLEQHPKVERVFYPGLASHPDHVLAKSQQQGFGGMVAFTLRGGIDGVHKVLGNTRIFLLAESLGGVESLIGHPVTMSHMSIRPEQRAAAGITDNIIRLSVGIEAQQDLIDDLKQALEF